MKVIILGIIAFLSLLLVRVKEGLGFTDANINTASFDATGTIPEYKDPGTRQWGQKMANNAAAAYRYGGREMLINNQSLAAGASLIFDSERDYRNSYLYIRGFTRGISTSLPFRIEPSQPDFGTQGGWKLTLITDILSTTAQDLLDNGDLVIFGNNDGGFTIRNDDLVDTYYFTLLISEIRLLTGA